jgi:molybdate transport system substrate-binding protein
VWAISGAVAAGAHVRAPSRIIVFAAVSLKNALDDVTPVLERQSGAAVRVSYAATSALARQIEMGAPAAVFIAADVEWMDYLATRKLIDSATRVNLLGNRLVLVAPRDQPIALTIAPGFALAAALGNGRLALADPAAVPAGKYARSALVALGVWPSVASRLAPAENVRAALLLVARGEAPLGIVYDTDARAEPGVRVVGTFPPESHPPIVYPAAVTAAGAQSAAARRLLAALQDPAARAVFVRHGFAVLPH